MPPSSKVSRLYTLDAARTLAALAVVLVHWHEHFFTEPRFAAPVSHAPLFSVLQIFYTRGARAVTFFFCLSGFLFFWLYAESIKTKSVSAYEFAVLRLSRLYPLHLLTLLICLVLGPFLVMALGHPFFYQHNDGYHFGLNLLLAQTWGFEHGYSWNGPSWSISVELALYLIFFASMRIGRPTLTWALALALAAWSLGRYSIVTSSAVAFFFGGVFYYVYRWITSRHPGWTPYVAAITAALWIALEPIAMHPKDAPQLVHGLPVVGHLAGAAALFAAQRVFEWLLFPALILTLACTERRFTRVPWARLGSIGDLSFGIYLYHYPLQAMFVLAAVYLQLPSDAFTSPIMLVLFLGALIMTAMASFKWFERPAMGSLRQCLLVKRSPAPATRRPADASA